MIPQYDRVCGCCQVDTYGTIAHKIKAAMTNVKLARLPTTVDDVRSRCRAVKHALDLVQEELNNHEASRLLISRLGEQDSCRRPSLSRISIAQTSNLSRPPHGLDCRASDCGTSFRDQVLGGEADSAK